MLIKLIVLIILFWICENLVCHQEEDRRLWAAADGGQAEEVCRHGRAAAVAPHQAAAEHVGGRRAEPAEHDRAVEEAAAQPRLGHLGDVHVAGHQGEAVAAPRHGARRHHRHQTAAGGQRGPAERRAQRRRRAGLLAAELVGEAAAEERAEDLAQHEAAGEPGCGVLVQVAAGQLRDHGRGHADTVAAIKMQEAH